jgi:hypothetical protein
MASLPSAENRSGHAMARDLKWSHREKGIARKAFERAPDREFQAVIRTTKEMAGKIAAASAAITLSFEPSSWRPLEITAGEPQSNESRC